MSADALPPGTYEDADEAFESFRVGDDGPARDELEAALLAAAKRIREDERERIAKLAEQHQATYRPEDPDLPAITGIPGDTKPGPDPLGDPFADLIREPS